MTGQTISHYRIAEKLGEGGMGVVYRAEDIKLGRTVALKFLLPHFVSDEATRQRFLREAQAAAALNHSNICTVYEIDDPGGQTFIAMEFVDGPSVADKLRPPDRPERPLPVEEALDIAIQTAQGLHAAHEKGVVHRDVKSANILLTQSGQVKITDFGLAHLAERSRLTKSGTSMGTPAFMSPEQAQNLPTNHRTDIWSLGVMLYEMLTGRLPFEGQYEQAIVYSIINEDPEPVTALRSGLPVELDRIVAKALEKRVQGRYQHIDDLVVDLQALQRGPAVHTQAKQPPLPKPPRGEHTPAPAVPLRARWVWNLGWVVSGAAIAAAMFIGSTRTGRSPSVEAVRFVLYPPAGASSGIDSSAVSPDGRQIAFASHDKSGQQMIWLRDLGSPAVRPLRGTEGANQLFWSPDSRQIGLYAPGKLKTVSVSAGPVQVLAEASLSFGGTWGSSGEIVANLGRRQLDSVGTNGGKPRPVTVPDRARGENSHRWPSFLPDGRRFLYTARSGQRGNTSIFVGSLDSTEVRRILDVPSNAAYAPLSNGRGGYLLYVRAGALLAHPFDTEKLELSGEPAVVAEGVASNVGAALARFSVSADGRVLAFQISKDGGTRQLSWFGRDGSRLGVVGPQGEWTHVQISPDGKRAAAYQTDPQTGLHDIWTIDLESGIPTRLTSGAFNAYFPEWSPDGRQIAYVSDPEGIPGIYLRESAPTGNPTPLLQLSEPAWVKSWSPDGKWIAYRLSPAGESGDIWFLPLSGNRKPIPVVQTEFIEAYPELSPDGRLLAYVSNETGEFELYVRPIPQNAAELRPERGRRITTGGAGAVRWRADGKELFYATPDNTIMSFEIFESEDFRASAPKPLFRACNLGYTADQINYDARADGTRFLISCPVGRETDELHVWFNWSESLKQ